MVFVQFSRTEINIAYSLTNVESIVHVDQANSTATVEDQTYFIGNSRTNEQSVNVSVQ